MQKLFYQHIGQSAPATCPPCHMSPLPAHRPWPWTRPRRQWRPPPVRPVLTLMSLASLLMPPWWRLHFCGATLFECSRLLNTYYNEAVHWKRNFFKIPYGKVRNLFVHELSRLFCSYAEAFSLESVALVAIVLFPILVLQKPHPQSKPRDLIKHLSLVFHCGLRVPLHLSDGQMQDHSAAPALMPYKAIRQYLCAQTTLIGIGIPSEL